MTKRYVAYTLGDITACKSLASEEGGAGEEEGKTEMKLRIRQT